jgi:prolyl-tRNA editing enzyme YbaK/EbsC (Cys-tRNA(Pro) deacylase)
MNRFTLQWEPAATSEAPARSVVDGVGELERLGAFPILAARVPAEAVGGEDFAAFADVPRLAATNCLIVVGSRANKDVVAALLIPGGMRADLNGRVRRALGARRVSLADDTYLERAGMTSGAVGPIGLPAEWVVLIERTIFDMETIYCGGGDKNCKLSVRARDLAMLPFVQVENLLKEDPTNANG